MLAVWLPLDGDLRNLGASNATITNSSATISTAGKIGSCYSFAKNAYLDINKETMQNFNNAVSICFWIKINSWNTNWDTIFQAGKGSTAWTQYHIGILRNSANYLCWTLGDGSTASNANYQTGNITVGQWTHVACTYGEGKWATYLNGILSNSGTTTIVPNFSNITSIKIGGLVGAYKCDCLLNDFRIYNHCLSAAEVHEIAMGLVLHYKLDGNGFGNPNLLANSKLDGSWTYPTSSYSDKYSPITTSIPTASQYTLSFEAKSTVNGDKIRTHYYSPNTTTTCVSNQGVSKGASDGNMDFTLTTNWEKYWVIYSQSETTAVKHIICPRLVSGNGTGTISVRNVKLEEGNIATPWCPNAADTLYSTLGLGEAIVKDSSGYGHNGEIINSINVLTDTPRYSQCTHISATNQKIKISGLTTSGFGNSYSFVWWAKISSASPMHWGFSDGIRLNGMYTGTLWNTGDSSANPLYKPGTTTQVSAPSTGVWHHYAMVGDGSTCKVYLDGEFWAQAKTYKAISGTTIYINGWDTSTNYSSNDLSISDFRIYCTPLLDTDIKLLYNMGMRVDNLGGVHSFELNENQPNLMWRPESARAAGLGINWAEGLGAYTQSNCQVTCDKNGYRIYRPPNLTVSSNGNTMWGGLRIRNSTNSGVHTYNASTDNIFGLIKGHTYIFIITVEGKSSNNFTSLGITNNMGWGGGGLVPSPSNVTYKLIGTNFNGKTECYYKFTVSDDIVKTCTSTYSSFASGNQYLSYMDFMFGFGYESTGSLGTDLYISNIRLLDVTNKTSKNIQKTGIIEFTQFIEKEENITKIRNDEELYATEFIEI